MVALPLDEAKRTLHQLFLIELFVTGAALVAAMIAGGWLVRIGPPAAARHRDHRVQHRRR